jgi:hypothetical protein
MPNRHYLLALSLLVLAVFLSGCGNEPTIAPISVPTTILESPLAEPTASQTLLAQPSPMESPPAYPPPTEALPGYPAPPESPPSSAAPSTLEIPTPSPGKGVVIGEVVDSQTQQAPFEVILYLGGMIQMDNGIPVVRLDRETAPFAIPVQDGRFAIADVEPGEYGVIVFSPDGSFMADNPDGSGSLVVKVTPGETVDVGRIVVTIP